MNKFCFKMAWLNLFGIKKDLSALGFALILSIALALSVQTITLSIFSGFEEVFQKSILAFNSHLLIKSTEGIDENEELPKLLKKSHFGTTIEEVSPFIFSESIMTYKGKMKGVVLKGIEFNSFNQVYSTRVSFLKPGLSLDDVNLKGPQVILGEALFHELFGSQTFDVSQGFPKVLIFSPAADISQLSNSKNYLSLEVVGTFSSGLYEFDSHFAFLPIQYLQEVYGMKTKVSGYEIKISHFNLAHELAAQMRGQLPLNYEIASWDEWNEEVLSSLHFEKVLFFIFMTLLLLLASVNQIGLMVVMILSSKKQILLFKALGLKEKYLNRIFIFSSLIMSFLGFFLGVLLFSIFYFLLKYCFEFPLSQEVYLVKTLPLSIHYSWFGISAFLSLFINFVMSSLGLKQMRKVRVSDV